MEKYRIVEAKIPRLSHPDGAVDFVPNIEYEYRYDIEYEDSLLFGLIKRWEKCGSFNTLKRAQQQIKFWKERETWKVIDVD